MMPNITQGSNTYGLVKYLFGPGRANEHEHPHVITGSSTVATLWEGEAFLSTKGDENGSSEVAQLARLLDGHMRRTGTKPVSSYARFDPETQSFGARERQRSHVWHCSLSLAPGHRPVSEETWREIAHDFMQGMGFGSDDLDGGAHWVAVHHGASKNGGDHIHIVANVVQQDGRCVRLWQSKRRSQQLCNQLEKKYGLEILDSRENNRAAVHDSAQALNDARANADSSDFVSELTQRQRLQAALTAAATAATSEKEFVKLARAGGVMIYPRYAKGDANKVVGYRAAVAGIPKSKRRWFSPSKIARDLSLTRLRTKWEGSEQDALLAWKNDLAIAHSLPVTQEQWQGQLAAVDALSKHLDAIPSMSTEMLAATTQEVAGYLNALAYSGHDDHWAKQLQQTALRLGQYSQIKTPPRGRYRGNRQLKAACRAAMLVPRYSRRTSPLKLARASHRLLMSLQRHYRAVNQYQAALQQARNAHDLMQAIQASQVVHQAPTPDSTYQATHTVNRPAGYPPRPSGIPQGVPWPPPQSGPSQGWGR